MADKKRILVVDDDKNITDLTQMILESSGYQCNALNNSRECANHLEESKYDLVLLDVAMPNFSGIDVVNTLKQKGIFEKQMIVFFTASSMGMLEEPELKKLGIDLIKKPFSKTILLEKIRTWIPN